MVYKVLIVPYGIETKVRLILCNDTKSVLIVPYGIETNNSLKPKLQGKVLIVPYGIETPIRVIFLSFSFMC